MRHLICWGVLSLIKAFWFWDFKSRLVVLPYSFLPSFPGHTWWRCEWNERLNQNNFTLDLISRHYWWKWLTVQHWGLYQIQERRRMRRWASPACLAFTHPESDLNSEVCHHCLRQSKCEQQISHATSTGQENGFKPLSCHQGDKNFTFKKEGNVKVGKTAF